jgi:hypothetical protein
MKRIAVAAGPGREMGSMVLILDGTEYVFGND